MDKLRAWFGATGTDVLGNLLYRMEYVLKPVNYIPNKEYPAGVVDNYILNVIKPNDMENFSEILDDASLENKFSDRLVNKL